MSDSISTLLRIEFEGPVCLAPFSDYQGAILSATSAPHRRVVEGLSKNYKPPRRINYKDTPTTNSQLLGRREGQQAKSSAALLLTGEISQVRAALLREGGTVLLRRWENPDWFKSKEEISAPDGNVSAPEEEFIQGFSKNGELDFKGEFELLQLSFSDLLLGDQDQNDPISIINGKVNIEEQDHMFFRSFKRDISLDEYPDILITCVMLSIEKRTPLVSLIGSSLGVEDLGSMEGTEIVRSAMLTAEECAMRLAYEKNQPQHSLRGAQPKAQLPGSVPEYYFNFKIGLETDYLNCDDYRGDYIAVNNDVVCRHHNPVGGPCECSLWIREKSNDLAVNLSNGGLGYNSFCLTEHGRFAGTTELVLPLVSSWREVVQRIANIELWVERKDIQNTIDARTTENPHRSDEELNRIERFSIDLNPLVKQLTMAYRVTGEVSDLDNEIELYNSPEDNSYSSATASLSKSSTVVQTEVCCLMGRKGFNDQHEALTFNCSVERGRFVPLGGADFDLGLGAGEMLEHAQNRRTLAVDAEVSAFQNGINRYTGPTRANDRGDIEMNIGGILSMNINNENSATNIPKLRQPDIAADEESAQEDAVVDCIMDDILQMRSQFQIRREGEKLLGDRNRSRNDGNLESYQEGLELMSGERSYNQGERSYNQGGNSISGRERITGEQGNSYAQVDDDGNGDYNMGNQPSNSGMNEVNKAISSAGNQGIFDKAAADFQERRQKELEGKNPYGNSSSIHKSASMFYQDLNHETDMIDITNQRLLAGDGGIGSDNRHSPPPNGSGGGNPDRDLQLWLKTEKALFLAELQEETRLAKHQCREEYEVKKLGLERKFGTWRDEREVKQSGLRSSMRALEERALAAAKKSQSLAKRKVEVDRALEEVGRALKAAGGDSNTEWEKELLELAGNASAGINNPGGNTGARDGTNSGSLGKNNKNNGSTDRNSANTGNSPSNIKNRKDSVNVNRGIVNSDSNGGTTTINLMDRPSLKNFASLSDQESLSACGQELLSQLDTVTLSQLKEKRLLLSKLQKRFNELESQVGEASKTCNNKETEATESEEKHGGNKIELEKKIRNSMEKLEVLADEVRTAVESRGNFKTAVRQLCEELEVLRKRKEGLVIGLGSVQMKALSAGGGMPMSYISNLSHTQGATPIKMQGTPGKGGFVPGGGKRGLSGSVVPGLPSNYNGNYGSTPGPGSKGFQGPGSRSIPGQTPSKDSSDSSNVPGIHVNQYGNSGTPHNVPGIPVNQYGNSGTPQNNVSFTAGGGTITGRPGG